jgi:hypothetical protein
MSKKYKYTNQWSFPESFKYFYGVEYDYDTSRNCSEEGCDGICRCSKIYNERVISVNLNDVVNHIVDSGNKKRHLISDKVEQPDLTFFKYCVHRLAVSHQIYSPYSWSVKTCRGYYGEEIDGADLNSDDFKNDVCEIYKLTPNERIEYVLKKEYGFLLDSLVEKTFNEREVQVCDLVVGNETYRKKIKSGTYTNENYGEPIGIYLKDAWNKYRLIDGYHRYVDLATGKKTVKIISAE